MIDSGLIEGSQVINNNILKYNYILTEKGNIWPSKLIENNEVPTELKSHMDELKIKNNSWISDTIQGFWPLLTNIKILISKGYSNKSLYHIHNCKGYN